PTQSSPAGAAVGEPGSAVARPLLPDLGEAAPGRRSFPHPAARGKGVGRPGRPGGGPICGSRPPDLADAAHGGVERRRDRLSAGHRGGRCPQALRPGAAAPAQGAQGTWPLGVLLMTAPSVTNDASLESLVARVVDDFLERQKRGEQPDPAEYA